jgi:hypothetical protein
MSIDIRLFSLIGLACHSGPSTKQGGANMPTYGRLGAILALAVAVTFVPAEAGMDEAKKW